MPVGTEVSWECGPRCINAHIRLDLLEDDDKCGAQRNILEGGFWFVPSTVFLDILFFLRQFSTVLSVDLRQNSFN